VFFFFFLKLLDKSFFRSWRSFSRKIRKSFPDKMKVPFCQSKNEGHFELGDFSLIKMNGTINLLDKEEASIEAYRSSQDEETHHHDDRVTKIEQDGRKLRDLKLREEVEDRIEEHVESGCARSQISSPPPMIILAAELEITHDNGDFCAGQNQDHENNRKESENIVELVQPDRRKDEEKLNEHSTERQDAAHENGEEGLHIPNLIRDLTGDLICSDQDFLWRFLESEITSEEDEGG